MKTGSTKRKAPAARRVVAKQSPVVHWRDEAPQARVQAGARLSVEAREPFVLHFGHDGWQQVTDLESEPQTSGWYGAGLDLKRVGAKHSLEFTRRFLGPRSWEQRDWQVRVDGVEPGQRAP